MTTWHTQDPRAFTSTHLDPQFYVARSVFPSSPAGSACGSTSSRSSGGRNRNTKACSYCRLRKIRCDGGVVCSNCTRTKRSCEYKEVSDEDNRAAKERKAFLKAQKLATGFVGRSPRGLKESASCPTLLLEGWQPKTEVRSSSPLQSTFDPSSSRPYPSVLLSSPLALNTPLQPSPEIASPFMDLNSTYDGQHSPSSSYTSYFPSSTSTPNFSTISSSSFSTPPASPLYPSEPRFDDIPSSSWIIPPNPIYQTTPTTYSTINTPSMDLSTSPVEPSTYIPLPEAGLGVGFVFEESFEPDATFNVPPLPSLPLAAEEPTSFIPQIDFGALEPFMGEGWVFDAPWEGTGVYEVEQAPQASWIA